MSAISFVRAREVLDSRGRPTVECDVVLADGTNARAMVPSGASTGRHEAVELRDGDPARYRGLGVMEAVAAVSELLQPAVVGLPVVEQRRVDDALRVADGTADKSAAGANAILAVSLAVARAAASSRGVPLYRHLTDLAGNDRPTVPLPMVNIISGGLHAGGQLDLQDVLVIPYEAGSFRSAIEHAVAVHASVRDRLLREGHPPLGADEGGWAPPLERNEDAIAWVVEAIGAAGVVAHPALDVAASHFHDDGTYRLRREGRSLDSAGMTEMVAEWAERFGVVSVEDPLAEDDWDGWVRLTGALGTGLQVVGDDLFVTNAGRLGRGIELGAANAILVKPNQIGTLTETLDVIAAAREAGYRTVVSARSGETEDPFVADLAVGAAAGQIKVGSVTRSSRTSKWNQLLRIEEALGPEAYVGASALSVP